MITSSLSASFVLIVPSGIETQLMVRFRREFSGVLIVPSGIETLSVRILQSALTVLIVPSGIETFYIYPLLSLLLCINCT